MIRRATTMDAGAIACLAAKMWTSHTVGALTAEFEAVLAQEDCAVFLAIIDGAAIGFAQCGLRHDYVEGTQSTPVGYLEGVFVEEGYRKHGYGAGLVRACEEWARETGCKEFASDCELNNCQSLAFHLKAGFSEANRIICFVKKL